MSATTPIGAGGGAARRCWRTGPPARFDAVTGLLVVSRLLMQYVSLCRDTPRCLELLLLLLLLLFAVVVVVEVVLGPPEVSSSCWSCGGAMM